MWAMLKQAAHLLQNRFWFSIISHMQRIGNRIAEITHRMCLQQDKIRIGVNHSALTQRIAYWMRIWRNTEMAVKVIALMGGRCPLNHLKKL